MEVGTRKARGGTRAGKVPLEAMMLLLLLLLNLLLPSLSLAQECLPKKDASELLSVDYYVDPSGTRYLARLTFADFLALVVWAIGQEGTFEATLYV